MVDGMVGVGGQRGACGIGGFCVVGVAQGVVRGACDGHQDAGLNATAGPAFNNLLDSAAALRDNLRTPPHEAMSGDYLVLGF